MRTQEEILKRIEERKPKDMLGFEWHEYLNALTPQSAEALRGTIIKKDADLSDWEQTLCNDESILKTCRDYMEFALNKANNQRGISANRSIMHYQAWLWLLGEDQFDDLMNDYHSYGLPQLKRISEFLANYKNDAIASTTPTLVQPQEAA